MCVAFALCYIAFCIVFIVWELLLLFPFQHSPVYRKHLGTCLCHPHILLCNIIVPILSNINERTTKNVLTLSADGEISKIWTRMMQ